MRRTFKPSLDGNVEEYYPIGAKTWAELRAGSGTAYSSDAPVISIDISYSTTTNRFAGLWRNIVLFDVSGQPIPALQATLSICGYAKQDVVGALPDINIYAAAPASNTELANGDFDSLGSTPYCDTAIAYGNFTVGGWNSFLLNATGLAALNAAIAGDGIFKVGFREATHDAGGATPPWTAQGNASASYLSFYSSEENGKEPKLVIPTKGSKVNIGVLMPPRRYGVQV